MADKEENQLSFFDAAEEDWKKEWQDMPEYISEDLTPYRTIYIHFANRKDIESFAKLINQRITDLTQSVWYPVAEIGRLADKRYIDES